MRARRQYIAPSLPRTRGLAALGARTFAHSRGARLCSAPDLPRACSRRRARGNAEGSGARGSRPPLVPGIALPGVSEPVDRRQQCRACARSAPVGARTPGRGRQRCCSLAFVEARYGEFALLRPRLRWHTLLLWLTPPLLLGAVAIALFSACKAGAPTAILLANPHRYHPKNESASTTS